MIFQQYEFQNGMQFIPPKFEFQPVILASKQVLFIIMDRNKN